MGDLSDLHGLDAQQLRELIARQQRQIVENERELRFRQTRIELLTHENATLKRLKFAAKSEQLNSAQRSLLEDTFDADLQAIEDELEQLTSTRTLAAKPKGVPKRAPLPAELPRTHFQHEPDSTVCVCGCAMKRIGEDVSEKLHFVPGVFSVERHVRGKWACAKCQTLIQAPVPAHVIDKGIPTAGLLAQVLVSKYADHMPLYRQQQMFGRAGLALPRTTLAQWVGSCGVQLAPLVQALKEAMFGHATMHADETPVAMLKPGSGKTHKAYLWAYSVGAFEPIKAVVYDFAETRAGAHARKFLDGWHGTLICDDYAGYKALFNGNIHEAGCLVHARRKFYDLWANHGSETAKAALDYYGDLYEIEAQAKELNSIERWRLRQAKAKPILDAMRHWLELTRQKVPDGSAIARAIDYSLKRWVALTRYLDDGMLPADNNWVENQIRPIAVGRSNWLFAGSLRAGKRAAVVMTLIQSARMNGHDPYAYLKDVMSKLPTHAFSRIDELLPHRWMPA